MIHDQRCLVEKLQRLFMGRGRRGDQPARLALRADQVQKRDRGAKRGLAVAARQQQHDAANDAPALIVARAIDPADGLLRPGIELERMAGRGVLRVLQAAQPIDGGCP